ncbi:MAG: PQQ-dependent sugar dehydrogenase [Solirubrobacteraceae bacterium]|nr:PQQ-dependent sugar dehydrogenase [Solirubrobacteraceae bacterium]
MRRWLFLVLAVVGLVAAPTAGSAAALESFGPAAATWGGTGATFVPIAVASPPNDPRVFVVQRGGVVRIAENGVVRPTPFLTVPGVDVTGERGLLSIAFPWDYAATGRFYVFATIGGTPAQIRVLEYRVGGDPNVADPASARTVLTQDLSTATNHNGGQLAFGPDWRLYVTIGDNTNRDAAQAVASQLGKVLRIDPADPDGVGPASYSVPADNPFPGNPVWAMGLRNPFRASFDAAGRLIVADVGEGTWEELNVGAPGANFGWPTCEGACAAPKPAGLTDPQHTYRHTDAAPLGGCSVIGGVVVRDPRVVGLAGRYLFGDFCRRDLRSADLAVAGGDPQLAGLATANGFTLIGFGDDARGCAYALADGTVYRVASASGDGAACGLTSFLPVPPDPNAPPAPSAAPPAVAPPVTPALPATPTPIAAAPKPSSAVVPKNCVRDGVMSIRAAGGRRITSVRLVRGKRQTPLKIRRRSGRAELRGLPSTATVKLSISVRGERGKVVRVTKTYKRCKAVAAT